MTRERWALVALAVLLLAVLATWGSREHTHTVERQSWQTEHSKLTEQIAKQSASLETMQKENETAETIEPVLLANGQVAYVTHRTSKTIETAMRQATEQIAQLTSKVSELTIKASSKEADVVRSAPRWNVVADVGLSGTDWRAGGGMNLGALSIYVTNPVSLTLQPRAGAMLRF